MINRILIRIKVLQILFAYYQNGSRDLQAAEKELQLSLRKSYDLYYYFLLLITDITYLQELIVDNRRNKYIPKESELNPNIRLIENRFAKQLKENKTLKTYLLNENISWNGEDDFLRSILELIIKSDIYDEYIKNPDDSYETDREFWRLVFKRLICGNENIEEYLEDRCIYWNDDIEIIETFVIKTIKKFDESKGAAQSLLPMFKDREDEEFAVALFRQSVLNEANYRDLIEKHMKNWETERIANMDLIIMQVALAELLNFPSIPTNVTLNEYIDAAKFYSTPKSGTFINGILDSVVKDLKKEKILLKD